MQINNPDYLIIIKQVPDPQKPQEGGVTITAPLPETTAYDTASEYSTPFAQGMLSSGNLMQAAASAGTRLTTQAMTAQLWQGSTENEVNLELEFQTWSDPYADVMEPVLSLLKFSAASIDTATGLLKSPGPRISLEDTGRIAADAAKQLGSSLSQAATAAGTVVGLVQTTKTLNGPNANLNANQKANGTPPPQNGLGGAQYWKSVIKNQISVQIGRYAFFDSVVILNAQETLSNQIDHLTGLPLHAKVSLRFKPMFLVTQQDLDKIFARRA